MSKAIDVHIVYHIEDKHQYTKKIVKLRISREWHQELLLLLKI
jgi:hypothetical protein